MIKTTKSTSLVVPRMRTTNPRWPTAAILKIENSLYLCNRSSDHDEILQEHADSGCKPCEKLKFAYFRNSRWRTAAILEIENSLYLCNRSSYHDEILHEYVLAPQTKETLKFAYFKNSRRQKIGNISATVQPIATKFCTSMQILAVNRAKI